jgi:hypothetical protein
MAFLRKNENPSSAEPLEDDVLRQLSDLFAITIEHEGHRHKEECEAAKKRRGAWNSEFSVHLTLNQPVFAPLSPE